MQALSHRLARHGVTAAVLVAALGVGLASTLAAPWQAGVSVLAVLLALGLGEFAQRRAQAPLRLAARAFESSAAIAITDAQQKILAVNPAFTHITGYSAGEARGRITGQLLRSGRHGPDFYAAMWRALARDRHWQGEVWNRRKNGEIFPEWLSITAVVDAQDRVTHFVAAFADITAKKRADEWVRRLAFSDPLTELPNRRLLRERLQQAMASSEHSRQHLAVLFIDLDRFKQLNDTHGHPHGDRLLVVVARRLQASVREHDTVARSGGDEFVVVLTGLSTSAEVAAQEARAIADKARVAVGQPCDLAGVAWRSTPSVGLALGLGREVSAEELLARADAAMYTAKRRGRNAVVLHGAAAALH